MLFIWNRWRYDVVALLVLLVSVFLGLVPADRATEGFSHPAIVTVASVLILSKALENTGVVNIFVRLLTRFRSGETSHFALTTGLTALMSGFMNNIGALALMLPVALRDTKKSKRAASRILMPLSFASLLGGLVTLIGTPPNIVIAAYREELTGESFSMFDFTPVGLTICVVGLLFIVLIGWRLIPKREQQTGTEDDRFQITNYMFETRILTDSPLANKTIADIEDICDNEVTVMAIIRNDRRRIAPHTNERVYKEDILVLEGDPEALAPLYEIPGLAPIDEKDDSVEVINAEGVDLMEAVVMPHSPIDGWSMRGLKMHERYGINLLAVARQGESPKTRLRHVRFKTGDVLLLQGERNELNEAMNVLGCLPLAKRRLRPSQKRRVYVTPCVFVGAIAGAAGGLVPIQIAFLTAVAILILTNTISLRDAYRSIDWPIIVLLGCLIPLGHALQSTGTTTLLAATITDIAQGAPIWIMLCFIIGVSMLLSDLVHNTPTAVLMAPIAGGIAQKMGISPDAFLMAVAVGSASAYLTPFGHPSNTLVMGPGGYRFGDYWRLGLPLDFLILLVAVPMIAWIWL